MLDVAQIKLGGDWENMVPEAAVLVIDSMRRSCLEGVSLSSEGHPALLQVDRHTSGPPAVWLHRKPNDVGWIIVNIGIQDWSKLAYQFGHELGHILANSWMENAKPAPPCQWLEEALVEAFSLRGLAHLADNWSRNPPFPGDTSYGASLAVYRQNIVELHGKLSSRQGLKDDMGSWFKIHRAQMESQPFLNDYSKAASLIFMLEYENDPQSVSCLGALNRWPGRTSLPLALFLDNWQSECSKLRLPTSLPGRLRSMLLG